MHLVSFPSFSFADQLVSFLFALARLASRWLVATTTVRWIGVIGGLAREGRMVTVKTKALQAGAVVMLRRATRSLPELMLDLPIDSAP